jgi:hypothetical protein
LVLKEELQENIARFQYYNLGLCAKEQAHYHFPNQFTCGEAVAGEDCGTHSQVAAVEKVLRLNSQLKLFCHCGGICEAAQSCFKRFIF